MIARAVWTGLAALLTISLGTAIAVSSGAGPTDSTGSPVTAWLLSCLFGLATSAVPGSLWRRTSEVHAEWRSPGAVAVTAGAGFVISVLALALLGALHGSWQAAVSGGVLTLVVLFVCAVFGPRRQWRPSVVGAATTLVVVSVGLPVVAFAGAGGLLAEFPWQITPALLLALTPLVLNTHEELLAGRRREREQVSDRLLSIVMMLLSFFGLVAITVSFPAPWEIRLLGVAPAAVVSLCGLGAILHPTPSEGRRLAGVLASLSYCSAAGALALVTALA